MKRSWIHLFALALVVLLPRLAAAQDASAHVERGIAAFREGRYSDAANAFEQATDADPQNAQAYFLLARIYAETPLKDNKKANRALDAALELEPDNLSFLVGKIQQLREEASNFFAERIREARRMELAERILRLDSTNAFAHEELGRTYIHDFWRYRNAVMLPHFRFTNRSTSSGASGMGDASPMQEEAMSNPNMPKTADFNFVSNISPDIPDFDPTAVFQGDRFDFDMLQQRGVAVVDLSRRAQQAYDRAIGHLNKALQADPRRRSVYDDLMEIYALKGAFQDAVTMLDEMHSFFPEESATWRYLGLAHYRLGNLDAAHKSFETALGFMTEEEKQAFTSLDFLLPDAEEERYEQDPVAYASRFWTSKDPRYLTTYNERRLEHYARLTYADLLYGSDDLKLRGWQTQRGRILVRYGLPHSDVVLVPGETGSTLESVMREVMSSAAGEAMLAEAAGALGDPTLARQRLLAARGRAVDMAEEANTYNIWDYGDFRFVFEDPYRNQEYRLYSPPADEISQGAVDPWMNDYVIRAEETFREVPERYEYEAPGRQIQIPYLVTAFKGSEGKADLYVHYGIPITQMPKPDEEMINVTAHVGAFLINDQRDLLVEERRTIYGLQTAKIVPFKDTQLWVNSQEMAAPPGHHEVSMEFETASGATVAVQRRSVDVPDFSSGRLALSDVLLAYHIAESPDGRPAREADLVRHGLSITPAPWSVFSGGAPIYLYFEAYGLTRGAEGRTDYEVEALLVPKDRSRGLARVWKGLFGGDRGVAVRLPGSGTSTEEGQYLIMDATDQPTGLYTLVLRVHDKVSGKDVHKEMDLLLE